MAKKTKSNSKNATKVKTESKVPFVFREQKNQYYYHNLALFVMGVDVTPWLTSDISVTYGKNGGINTLSFNLSNQMDAFVLTEDNLVNKKYRMQDPYSPTGEYSELAKFQMWSIKNAKNKDGTHRNLQHEVASFGPQKGSGNNYGGLLATSKNASQVQSTVTYRYPFSPKSLVIHKFDHVRLFAKNPLSTNNDEWYCVYSGFIDQKPFSEDAVTGMSTIRLSCQDIRYAMSRMRTQANPAASIGNGNAAQFAGKSGRVKDSPKAGYFNDLIAPTWIVSHVLGGLSFRESINFLILGKFSTGATNIPTASLGPATGKKVSLNTVGEFKKGKDIKYDPSKETRKTILEQWNNLITFGDYSLNPKFLTYAEMQKMGQTTHEWGENSIWARSVHCLWPNDGSPNINLIETSVDGRTEDKIQWGTRLELLLDVCENIDYVMYVSPLGDIIFEFPMWDFSPDDYGSYENLYKFQHHIISRSPNDEGGEAVSGVVVNSNVLSSEKSNPVEKGGGNVPGVAADIELTRTIYSNALASRIGVQIKTIYKPGVVDQGKLTKLGFIEFAKATAEYDKHSFSAQYRPFLIVNRPIYDVEAYRIGNSNTINYTWRIRESAEVDLDLNFIRKGEIDKDGKVTFRFITGGEANPISYNKIFTDNSLKNVGINSATKEAKK